MKQRENSSFGTPGGSALMIIFAVLCLVVFAVLALTTVLAEARLAEASDSAVSGYYEADALAEETLARLRAGERPEGVTEENGVYSYECPISDTQAICVRVRVEEDGSYEILRWQEAYTAAWQSDDSLLLLAGD